MNTALSTWQLIIMAVVPVATLVAWIMIIFHVAKEPVRTDVAAAGVTDMPATAGERDTTPTVREPVAA